MQYYLIRDDNQSYLTITIYFFVSPRSAVEHRVTHHPPLTARLWIALMRYDGLG